MSGGVLVEEVQDIHCHLHSEQNQNQNHLSQELLLLPEIMQRNLF